MPREAGHSYGGDGRYDRGVTAEFGRLANAQRKELGLNQTELAGRIVMQLQHLGRTPKYELHQVARVLNGQAGAAHLQTWRVEAWIRALEITDPLIKAHMYAAAGHKPAGITLERYAKAFEREAVAS